MKSVNITQISAPVIMKPIFVVVQIHENVVSREVHQTVGWLSMKTLISRDTMVSLFKSMKNSFNIWLI